MVDAQNWEVQIHQSHVRDSPLHRDDFDLVNERTLESGETLVEYCTENEPIYYLAVF